MFFFEGSKCPVCSESFVSGDDVVACPVCGAPHHRACYKENGCCAYEERHSEGFIWTPEDTGASGASDDIGSTAADGSDQSVCPSCGAENPEGRLYCIRCGAQLFDSRSAGGDNASGSVPTTGSAFISFGGEAAISDGELIEDVPVGDLKRFVGSSSFYYIPQFVMMARALRRVSLNFFAFLAHGLWFISRKMYVLGGALLALQLGVFAFETYCTAALNPYIGALTSSDYAETLAATTQLLEERPLLVFGLFASVLIQYGTLFFSGIFGNRIYMKFCLKKIRGINRLSSSAEQFNNDIEAAGGSAMLPAIGFGILYIAAKILLQNRIGL